MIVISLTDCPPRVRGDLSKWLCEINTGVYVGNVSARVRDELWERICENLRNGRATMVYPSDNEQGYTFRAHNTTWEPVDYDGITLMRRPKEQPIRSAMAQSRPLPLSDAESIRIAQMRRKTKRGLIQDYSVIDLETTGLSASEDQIIEMAALRVVDGKTTDSFTSLIQTDRHIPESSVKLTGITEVLLARQGVPLATALPKLLEFIDDRPIVGYNVTFDIAFLRSACARLNLTWPRVRAIDVLELARQKLLGIQSLKLERIAEYFKISTGNLHRALNDCEVTEKIYRKLQETK